MSFSGANIGPSAVRKVTSILRLAFGWKPENEHIRPVDTISGYLVNEKPVSSSSRFGGERTLERIRRRKGVANFFFNKKKQTNQRPNQAVRFATYSLKTECTFTRVCLRYVTGRLRMRWPRECGPQRLPLPRPLFMLFFFAGCSFN